MVQFLSIIFFSWISSIFVGFFKSSCFLCHPVYDPCFWYNDSIAPDLNVLTVKTVEQLDTMGFALLTAWHRVHLPNLLLTF